jgi:hypothetical protein
MDIPSWAVRGSRVACLHDDWSVMQQYIVDPEGLARFPTTDVPYTIREVRIRYVSEYSEVIVGVLLEEVVNPIAEGGSATGEEMAFDVRCFRPLQRVKAAVYVPAKADA